MKKWLVEFVTLAMTGRVIQGALEVHALAPDDATQLCIRILGQHEPIDVLNCTEVK